MFHLATTQKIKNNSLEGKKSDINSGVWSDDDLRRKKDILWLITLSVVKYSYDSTECDYWKWTKMNNNTYFYDTWKCCRKTHTHDRILFSGLYEWLIIFRWTQSTIIVFCLIGLLRALVSFCAIYIYMYVFIYNKTIYVINVTSKSIGFV